MQKDQHTETRYHANGEILFQREVGTMNPDYWVERTFDETGKQLTYRNSQGYYSRNIYDQAGNLLRYANSEGIIEHNNI